MDKRVLSQSGLAVVVAGIATLAVAPGYSANLVMWMAIAVLMAASLRFVLLIGELNFATAAFVGLGAYGAGVSTTILAMAVRGRVAAQWRGGRRDRVRFTGLSRSKPKALIFY